MIDHQARSEPMYYLKQLCIHLRSSSYGRPHGLVHTCFIMRVKPVIIGEGSILEFVGDFYIAPPVSSMFSKEIKARIVPVLISCRNVN